MNTAIQSAVEAGKISEATATALGRLSEGTCIVHKSWGFGKIARHDFDFNQTIINFTAKPGHAMQFQYAAESLKPLADDHILARIAEGADAVRAEATEKPVQFTAGVLAHHNNRMTQDEFTKILVPAVFREGDFKKWWDDTKKLLKKDGHFSLPTKKSDPILYRSEAVSHAEQHLSAFQQARQVKDQISALEKILRSLDEIADHAAQVQPLISDLEESARRIEPVGLRHERALRRTG
jgi:transcription elongation factor GreA-like protein